MTAFISVKQRLPRLAYSVPYSLLSPVYLVVDSFHRNGVCQFLVKSYHLFAFVFQLVNIYEVKFSEVSVTVSPLSEA